MMMTVKAVAMEEEAKRRRRGRRWRRPAGIGGAPCTMPPAAAAGPLCPFLHGRRFHRHLHRQFLLVYSGSSSHTPLYPSM